MRLNISGIQGRKGAFFQVKRDLPGDFLQTVPEVSKVLGPISAELTVTNTGDAYLVTGDFSVDLELRCSRCLKPLRITLEASCEEEFLKEPELGDEEDFLEEQLVVEGSELDTTSLIEDSLLISLPMKVVCSPDCPGLCTKCGAVLADGDCGCSTADVDIRLAPLMKLLEASSQEARPERRKDHGSTKEKTLQSKGKLS
ncbi:MAG TPA: DUF177 domain-containing protein [Firmicutes bacterium]|jgi:uncharacterized protein|nr:DUF177 domain-containing protein [Bacillota bacterium]